MSHGPDGLPCALPDFAIIGAMKAGTTTLYHALLEHPDIGMSRMKETDYFCQHRDLSNDWYRRQFEPGCTVYGEASPNYTKRGLFPGVPEALAEAAPGARMIFIARDPVERLVSHYRHSWLLGHMAVPPEQLAESEPWTHMLDASRYHAQMQPWLAHFPRDRLLILDFERLRIDPQGAVDAVCHHIGVAHHPVTQTGPRNSGGSLARMPRSVQRLWQSKAMRRLDPLISRNTRDMARKMLSRGPERKAPELTPELLEAAAALRKDAQDFRELSGLSFESWRV